MTADVPPLVFNPLQDGYVADPWPHLGQMRDGEPVHRLLTGQWGLFCYDDVFSLLRDPQLSVDIEMADLGELDRNQVLEGVDLADRNRSMLNIDPPDHTRLRRLVSKAFTPRTIQQLSGRIGEMVDAILDQMADQRTSDVVAELAFPLPFDVISEMLGMPPADADKIKVWSAAMVKTLDPIVSDDEAQFALESAANMHELLAEVIDWKRAHPGDDLLTGMLEAEEDGDRLTTRELQDQVTLLFIAGHETTVNLIGTGIFELLRNPDQLHLVKDSQLFPPHAVDELLRYVSPVQISRRIATSDLKIRGNHIPKGAFVLASLASANRDEQFWGDTANELDLTRANAGQHVSFGSGAHYCLGASLAKLEAEVAIGGFIRRFGCVAIAEEPTWNGRINLRGLESLVVRTK